MIVQVSFYDDETGYAEPVYIGDGGKARDFLANERILHNQEIKELFDNGYTLLQEGEFFWEEL